MTMSRKHVAWVGVGLTIAMTAGSPVLADDTELLLSTPSSTGADKPNILFILDSSGSMTSIETTQQPFDGSANYPGSCLSNKYYWSTSTTNVPGCGSGNEKLIDQDKFTCAAGVAALAASGKFADTMTQYRRGGSGSSYKWRRPRSNRNDPIECQADSGQHGAGILGEVYAQIGNNLPPFTDNGLREVSWGDRPTDRFVTVYDPNYLNWYHNSPVTSMSRTDIVKSVTKNVLGSISNVNVGFMRFHNEQGGPVTRAVKDLDSSRSAANATVNALPANGWTPLSETMYEAALYWRGQRAQYGQYSSTDSDALSSTSPMVYKKPTKYSCAKNYNVLLTDGEPTHDIDAYDRVSNLPNFTTTMGSSSCTGGKVNGSCLDDIAVYLSKDDINPQIPGDQTVTTYTIGFKVDLPLLKDTAEKSGGQYYLAEDVKTLTDVLTEIVSSIFDRDISFTAPAVAVNAFNRTQHLNDLYISVFRATNGVHWPGNLKKYTINKGIVRDANGNPAVDPTTGFFSNQAKSFWTPGTQPDGANVDAGGALSQIPDPADRNVYTDIAGPDLSASGNHISTSNSGTFSLSDFGLSGVAGEPTKTQMIEWVRGVDVRDIDNNPVTTVRKQMGDTLHSQPATIVYGGAAGSSANMDIVVYTATNDGQLHAFDAKTGRELWTFLPKELLTGMNDLFYDEVINYKNYGIDGDIVPVIVDRNHDGNITVGTDFVYLVFGMRRGGNNYYALDVTDKNAPKLKWISNYPQFGQTWSSPVPAVIKIPGASSPDDIVLVLGAGYDTTHDQAIHPSTADAEGAGIFMLDLETGDELWRAGADAGADLALENMTRSIPTSIRVLDMSGDGNSDRMYAADLGGQVWRFDISTGQSPANLVAGGVIGRFGAEGVGGAGAEDTRRLFSTPDISIFTDDMNEKRYLAISMGSGYRAHPLDKSAADRFYSLRDPDVFAKLSQEAYDAYPIAYDADLVNVSGQVNVSITPADRGWKFTLPPGEKVLAESRTFDDTIYFVSFEPEVASSDPCQAGLSINRLYRVAVANGDPVVDIDVLDANDPDAADKARVTKLEQGGIAVRPIFLFPSPLDPNCVGKECAPPPIGCVGVECFDPGVPNNPVRTLWTQDGIN